MRKLKVCARHCISTSCVRVHSFSECSHADAVQAECHINVVLQVESECVCLESVYVRV